MRVEARELPDLVRQLADVLWEMLELVPELPDQVRKLPELVRELRQMPDVGPALQDQVSHSYAIASDQSLFAVAFCHAEHVVVAIIAAVATTAVVAKVGSLACGGGVSREGISGFCSWQRRIAGKVTGAVILRVL